MNESAPKATKVFATKDTKITKFLDFPFVVFVFFVATVFVSSWRPLIRIRREGAGS